MYQFMYIIKSIHARCSSMLSVFFVYYSHPFNWACYQHVPRDHAANRTFDMFIQRTIVSVSRERTFCADSLSTALLLH